jgi:hypothetical protein
VLLRSRSITTIVRIHDDFGDTVVGGTAEEEAREGEREDVARSSFLFDPR